MNSDLLVTAGDAAKAFLSTLLGDTAPLKFSTLSISEVPDIQDDAKSLLGIYPEDHRFAVLLDPEWLPLIAGLKLGVQTRAGDDDYEVIFTELSNLFVDAVKAQLATEGIEVDLPALKIKETGEPLDEAVFERVTYKLPFFMEWEGALLHGFVLVTKADAQDSAIEVETIEEQQIPETAMEESFEAEEHPQDGATGDLGPSGIPTDAVSSSPPPAAPPTPAAPAARPGIQVQSAAFPELGTGTSSQANGGNLGLLAGVELEVTVELGRRRMALSDILRLTNGSVLELEKLVGEPLQIFANSRLIAEGEAVVIDEQFGVRITALAASNAAKLAR